MARRVLGWALVLFVAWTAGPATAQTASPLKAIPGGAAVVVRVKGFQGTLDKIAKLSDAVEPGSGNTIKFGGNLIGAGIQNPTMEGVDLAGDFYIAVFVEKDSEPAILFAIPGKDLDAMEEALGEEVTFVKQGKHGFYSKDEDLIDEVKEQAKSKEKDSLADAIDEKSMAVLNRGDLSVFVNVESILETYKDEFQAAKGQIESIKDQVPPGEAPAGVDMAALMQKVQAIASSAVAAVEDHKGISITLTVSDKDLVIEKFFKLKADSDTGKALKAGTGSDFTVINTLPADSLGYYGLQWNISDFVAWGMDFATSVIKDEKALEAVKGTMGELKKVKFGAMAGSVNLAKSDKGILNMVSLVSVDDPKKLRTIAQKYAEAVKEIEANGTKTEVSYKADAEKIGANSVDVTTFKITISDDAPNAEQQKAVQKLLYGEDGATSRTVYLKDKIVQVTGGGGKAAMEAALKAVESPARTPSASLAAVRSKLGAKPNFVGLVDIANLIAKGLGMAKDIAPDSPLPIDPEKIASGLNLKATYVGVGVEVQDAAVSTKLVIPVDQMKNIGQIVKKAISSMNQE